MNSPENEVALLLIADALRQVEGCKRPAPQAICMPHGSVVWDIPVDKGMVTITMHESTYEKLQR